MKMTTGTVITLTICFLILLCGATSIFSSYVNAKIGVNSHLEIASIQRETIHQKTEMYLAEFKSRMRILLSTNEIAVAIKELSDRGVSPYSDKYEDELVNILSRSNNNHQ